jgi:hypothetical protein
VTELLRRISLAAGAGYFSWLFFWTPAVLISVRPVDFAKEYVEEYSPRRRSFPGAMERAEELLRNTTDPGSASTYRARKIENRELPPGPPELASWVAQLDEAIAGQGPLASRAGKGRIYFLGSEKPVSLFATALEANYHRTQWLNAYATAGDRDIELMWENRPRGSNAPRSMVFPQRPSSWIPLLGALAAYLVLPRGSRRGQVRYDPVVIVVLDTLTLLAAAFFFALPLLAHDSTAAALNDIAGGTGVSWAFSALVAVALFTNAWHAAERIQIDQAGLHVRRLFSSLDIPLGAIATVEPLVRHGERTGVSLRLADGRIIPLRWDGRVDFNTLYRALRHAGFLQMAAAGGSIPIH